MNISEICFLVCVAVCLQCACSQGHHREWKWHCIWNFVPASTLSVQEQENLIHLRDDTWGESCNFYKLLENYAAQLAEETHIMYIPTYWRHITFLDQAAKHLKDNPPDIDNQLQITIYDVEMFYFNQAEWSQKITMGLLIHANWTDPRLSWTGKKPHPIDTDKILVHPKDIWHPDFAHGEVTQKASERYAELEASVKKGGTVSMKLVAYLHGNARMSYEGFPKDEHEGCVSVASNKYPDMIKFGLNKGQLKVKRWKKGWFPAWWKLLDSSVKQDNEEEKVNICLKLQRYSTIFIYKLILPLAACTFLAVVIPLFSGWILQIGSKLLATTLIFLCVLNTNQWEAAFGEDAPAFIKVYDFLIWTTITSVGFTVILWGLSVQQKKFLPPPQALSLVTNVVNPIFCFTNPPGQKYVSFGGVTEPDVENGPTEGANSLKDYSKDWSSVYLGINNILLLLYTIIYIIGLIVCSV